MITTAQIRGARGILNWSQGDLSERTGLSPTSVGGIENGLTNPRDSSIAAVQKAFEDAGIEFIANDGVRKRGGEILIFRGKVGFVDFFDYVFQTVRGWSGDVCVSNVEETTFLKWAGETAQVHMERMSRLEGIRYKVLLKEGDQNFAASSYAQYKWIPKRYFHTVPFYVFERKLAIFVFDEEPLIILHKFSTIAEAYRAQFEALWESAIDPLQTKMES